MKKRRKGGGANAIPCQNVAGVGERKKGSYFPFYTTKRKINKDREST